MNNFHKWLLRQRPFCEERECMKPSEYVLKDRNNKDRVYCDYHAHPIEVGYRLRQGLKAG